MIVSKTLIFLVHTSFVKIIFNCVKFKSFELLITILFNRKKSVEKLLLINHIIIIISLFCFRRRKLKRFEAVSRTRNGELINWIVLIIVTAVFLIRFNLNRIQIIPEIEKKVFFHTYFIENYCYVISCPFKFNNALL